MKKNRGFTLVELLVVVSIIALLVGLLLPALSRVRDSARQIKCATNVRAIHQGLVAWSQDSDGQYPLPSRFDPDNVSEQFDPLNETSKSLNRTGNVWSLMIFNKVLNPDIFISPAETNVNIRKPMSGYDKEHSEYNFAAPLASPTDTQFQAVYDPQFKGSASEFDDAADLTTENGPVVTPKNVGHNSYAHSTLAGVRLGGTWNTFAPSPNLPVVGNRGPMYESIYPTPEPDLGFSQYANEGIRSQTLAIHGGKSTWEGNVAYNDGHTEFETRPNPDGQRRIEFGGDEDVESRINDNLFVDEELPGVDVSARDNSYLRIWSSGLPLDPFLLNANGNWLQRPEAHYMWVD